MGGTSENIAPFYEYFIGQQISKHIQCTLRESISFHNDISFKATGNKYNLIIASQNISIIYLCKWVSFSNIVYHLSFQAIAL